MKRGMLALLVVAAVITAAFLTWHVLFTKGPSQSIVFVSGRIEGDDSAIAPKVAGRIVEIFYREGDSVHAGNVIAVLDDAQVRAQVDQA
ncbi:MAG: biotin/lipoyl-binding protein, partial [Candidatus Cybelea sp.]